MRWWTRQNVYICSIQRSLRARLHAFVCDKSHPLFLLDKQLRMTCTIMANDDDDAIRIYKTFRIAAASPSIVRVSVYGECLYRVWELAFQYADSRRRSVSSRARFGWSWCWMGVRDEWSPLFAEFAWFSYLRTVSHPVTFLQINRCEVDKMNWSLIYGEYTRYTDRNRLDRRCVTFWWEDICVDIPAQISNEWCKLKLINVVEYRIRSKRKKKTQMFPV